MRKLRGWWCEEAGGGGGRCCVRCRGLDRVTMLPHSCRRDKCLMAGIHGHWSRVGLLCRHTGRAASHAIVRCQQTHIAVCHQYSSGGSLQWVSRVGWFWKIYQQAVVGVVVGFPAIVVERNWIIMWSLSKGICVELRASLAGLQRMGEYLLPAGQMGPGRPLRWEAGLCWHNRRGRR